MRTKVKKKLCRICEGEFTPWSTLQVCCSPKCAAKYVTPKAQRAMLRRDKESIKTKPQLISEAQKAFNAFIRERDSDKPCISCGMSPNDNNLLTGSRWDAGHYRSVGACPELRFEELNCHKQCVRCNQYKSGSAVEYRLRLIDRIGIEKVEWLEGKHEMKHYGHDGIRAIRDYYRAKTRELKKARKAEAA